MSLYLFARFLLGEKMASNLAFYLIRAFSVIRNGERYPRGELDDAQDFLPVEFGDVFRRRVYFFHEFVDVLRQGGLEYDVAYDRDVVIFSEHPIRLDGRIPEILRFYGIGDSFVEKQA
jgi:hypothetical protein